MSNIVNILATKQLLEITVQLREKYLSLYSVGSHNEIEKEMYELEEQANIFLKSFFEKNTSYKLTKTGDWITFLTIILHCEPELLVNLTITPLLDRFIKSHNIYVLGNK